MEQKQSQNTASLEDLARAHFGRDFTVSENKLLASSREGKVAYCGPTEDSRDPSYDPSKALATDTHSGWSTERTIDARLIAWLCVDPKARDKVAAQGIQVHGALVTEPLNLAHVVVPFPLRLVRCAIVNIVLRQATMPVLDLQGCWTRAINAEGTVIKGHVLLRAGFHADGGVRFAYAQVGGNLECDGGTFKNPNGYAFNAQGLRVERAVLLRGGFRAEGEVRFAYAQIGANLECDNGTFENPSGDALDAELAEVKGYVFLCNGFTANGKIRLVGAQFGGNLVIHGAQLQAAELDLMGASAAGIQDDWPRSAEFWPDPGKLQLDGFVYARIAAGSRDAESRARWLALQPQKAFAAHPYLHLAKVLKSHGDDKGAANLLVVMEDRRRAANAPKSRLRSALERAVGWILKNTIGYGYRTLRAFGWILGFAALGWVFYCRSYVASGMVPTEKEAYLEFSRTGRAPAYYPAFSPLFYSVENSLPLVKLGQAEKWQPDPAFGTPSSRLAPSPRFLRYFLWVQILLGWILATLFLAGISGVIRKD